MKKNLPTQWTSNLKTQEEKESFIRHVNDVIDYPAVKRLVSIIEGNKKVVDKHQTDFDTPNWEYRQAFLLGQQKAYQNILDLLTKEDQSNG